MSVQPTYVHCSACPPNSPRTAHALLFACKALFIGEGLGLQHFSQTSYLCNVQSLFSICFVSVQPPKFEFYDPQSPIYTSPRFLPPAKILDSKIFDAIISHGAFLEECTVDNAIVGLRSRIGKNATIKASAVHPACLCLQEMDHAAQTSCFVL